MNGLILLAALTWPPECTAVGDVYMYAARIRDKNVSLERILKYTEDAKLRRVLRIVYQRPDMDPSEWRAFAIGTCLGTNAARGECEARAGRGAGPSGGACEL
jgi:hypothetical protein